MENRIREIRKERALTQSELAKILGVNQSIVQKLETGATDLDIPWMMKISKALDISPLELLPDEFITRDEIDILQTVRKKTNYQDTQIQEKDRKNLYKSKQR